MTKTLRMVAAGAALVAVAGGCGGADSGAAGDADRTAEAGASGAPAGVAAAGDALMPGSEYVAELVALNAEPAGSAATGRARLSVVGDSLLIEVEMQGVAPGMAHLQHFHGFPDGRESRCPLAAADVNQDGVVDLMETEATAGTTMVPFHGDPLSLEIAAETYPRADAQGRYTYRQTVPLASLQTAFEQKFGTRDLALGRRVVFVHGVPAASALPSSAASLGDVPAQVTLPVACGELRPAQ